MVLFTFKIEGKIPFIYMRRTKAGELKDELPNKTDHPPIRVSMGKDQHRMYLDIRDQFKNKEIGGLQAIQKLKGLCSHPGLIDSGLKTINSNEVPKLKDGGILQWKIKQQIVFIELDRKKMYMYIILL